MLFLSIPILLIIKPLLNFKNSFCLILFAGITILLSSCKQKAPDIEWQQSLGGSLYDAARCIRQTTDSGYIAVGFVNSLDGDVVGNHGASDFWILMLNKHGEVLRKECFGGDYYDEAAYATTTPDGGFIVTGHTYSFNGDVQGNHGGSDIWVMKFDKNGMIEWKKALGGSGHEYSTCIQQHKDGTFLIAGSTDSDDGDVSSNHGKQDAWLVKLDDRGNIILQKSIGGILTEYITSIASTRDGGYVLTELIKSGESDSAGNPLNTDYLIIKLGHDGNPEWKKNYGESRLGFPNSIIQTRDGGFAIAGGSLSKKENVMDKVIQYDGWIMKLDDKANLQWQKFYGGLLSEQLNSISQTSDGGYIAGGWSNSVDGDGKGNHGLSDFWLIRLNEKGNVKWTKSLGGSDDDMLSSLQLTDDGGYILCGQSTSNDGDVKGNHGNEDVWIVKLKAE
ncbi:MAG TPA: hypothetical protein VE978_10905 [Chitinophagales bacterium]|nr:hypothetical protein [Chitinophagales bacterium]